MSELRSPLYARVLGSAWHELPAEIREMHDLRSGLTAHGTAAVERGTGLLARLVETFSSAQFAGYGRDEHLLCERFGWLTFAMALVVEGGRLELVPRRWRVFGISIPMSLCLRVDAYESVEAGRFHFHVDIRRPLTGLIMRYRGALSRPEPI